MLEEDNLNENELENDDVVELPLDEIELTDDEAADIIVDEDDAPEGIEEETAAAATIKAKPSRTATIADIVNHATGLSDEDLNKFAESIKKPASAPDRSAANKASIAMHATKTVTKEELQELFGDDLSEEFREKTSTLFESAVNARVGLEVAAIAEDLEAKYAETVSALEEAYASTLEEETGQLVDKLYEQVDSYINYVAEQWLAQNEVAIETSLRSQLAEDFMGKMRELFVEHNLNVPAESEDLLEQAINEKETLEERLNAVLEENIQLKASKVETEAARVFAEETAGLADSQIDKIRTLAEGIETTDLETFTKKLAVIKESVTKKSAPSSGILTEEAPAVDADQLAEETKVTTGNPTVLRYAEHLSRQVKGGK